MPQIRLFAVLFFFAIIQSTRLTAQQCHPTFQAVLSLKGESAGQAVAYTPQGSILVAGKTYTTAADKWDGLLIKTTGEGTPVWAHSIGRSENDVLLCVKHTPDNGFVAAGVSETGGLAQLWVLKADAAGQPEWNKVIDVENQPITPKDIIALASGGYALVANTYDSTAQADGILVRLDAGGESLWVRQFDSGGGDGFNSLLEINGELLVAGFMAGDGKDAFLMRAALSDGQPSSVLQYSRFATFDEEGISLHAIPGGYSWGMKIAEKETGYDDYDTYLLAIKAQADGTNYLVQSQLLYPSGGRRTRNLQLRTCAGYGFAYMLDGPWGAGTPQIAKTAKEGYREWNRSYDGLPRPFNVREFNGFDLTGNDSYVVTGRSLSYSGMTPPYTQWKVTGHAVFLMRTDPFGIAGSCSHQSFGGLAGGADEITGKPSQWKTVSQPAVTATAPAMPTVPQTVTPVVTCTNQYCDPLPPADNGENCATSFHAAVREGYSTSLMDAVRTSDGDIVTIGKRNYYWNNRGQVIKLKPGGNVRWAKQFAPGPGKMGLPEFKRVINTQDNNILVVGSEPVTFNHSASDSGVVIKMDYNGNVLWSKHISDGGQKIAFVEETEDGGFIIAANPGGNTASGNIFKLDKNGNVVWQRAFNPTRRGLVIRAITYNEGSIYVASDVYNIYHVDEIVIAKLDASSGDFRWARHFKHSSEALSILGLALIGDIIYIGTGLLTELSWENYQFHGAVLKLKEDTGEQLQGFRLINPWMSTSRDYVWAREVTATTFTRSSDDQLVIAHESARNKDTTIRVHKLATDGNVIWSRNFTQLKKHAVNSVKADGAGLLVTGYKYGVNLANEQLNEGFVLRLNSDGNIEGGTGECTSEPVAAGPAGAYTVPLQLTEVPAELNGVQSIVLKIRERTGSATESPVKAYPSCPAYAACTAPEVSGPVKVCDLSITYTYTAQAPAGCTAPLSWETDPAYAEVIARTSSSLVLKFKKAGKVVVSAKLDAGCKTLETPLEVVIVKSAAVDLGADAEICKTSVVTLDAGEGFAAYEWNDGSTAQQLQAEKPGVYKVTVTDYCGNKASDEIKLSDGGNYLFSLGPDILKCSEETVTLNLPAGFGNFSWNTDYNRTVDAVAGKVTLSPELDTVYILQGDRGNGCLFKDTLLVNMHPKSPINLPDDRSLCSGDSIRLAVGPGFSNIRWHTGAVVAELMAKMPGEYTVIARDKEGCVAKDTFLLLSLLPAPRVSLPTQNYICKGTQQVLDAGTEGITYAWNTGAVTSRITVSSPGKWWVTVTGGNGCVTSDTTWFKQETTGPQGFLVPDTAMCLRGEITIRAKGQFASYRWSDGSSAPYFTTRTPGSYWLEVKDNQGCSGREYVNIQSKECGWGVSVPNAFTPNNDGTNDLLRPVVMGKVVKYEFSVFNRWGSLVFQSKEVNEGWNGRVNDVAVTGGAYIWVCKYQLENEEEKNISGTALLIR